MPETHSYITEYHVTPNRNSHLCKIPHLLSLPSLLSLYVFLWNLIKEWLKPTLISQNIMRHQTETRIYARFPIFWAYLHFCLYTFFMKPNSRMPETHLYIIEYHMTPNWNPHLCKFPHLLSLFPAMKPIFCTPLGGAVDYRDRSGCSPPMA